MSTLTTSIYYYTGRASQGTQAGKSNKRNPDLKERKSIYIDRCTILYTGKKLKTESAKNSCSIQGQYTKFNPFQMLATNNPKETIVGNSVKKTTFEKHLM